MEQLLNNSIEITNILVTAISIAIMPVIISRVMIKAVHVFKSFVVGGRSVKI